MTTYSITGVSPISRKRLTFLAGLTRKMADCCISGAIKAGWEDIEIQENTPLQFGKKVTKKKS